MPFPRSVLGAGLLGVLFFAGLPVRAGVIPTTALPIPNRVASADMVVIGKITAIEDKTVPAVPYPGAKDPREFKIALINVVRALRAPKDAKIIRLGFIPLGFGVRVSPPPFLPAVGQEGCFFLTKHFEADFALAASPLNFLDKNQPNYAKDIALVERCVKLLADLSAGLKAASAEDRFLTAAMLLLRYRTRKTPMAKTEPIDAGQSKLILEALASADWAPSTDFRQLAPQRVLYLLPLTVKDGWQPPPANDAQAFAAYARRWLTEHAESYRIERYVSEKK